MNCETCKHNFVCKYKEEYIRVKEKSNSDKFKGIFDICCNEYIECEYLDLSSPKQKINLGMVCPECNSDELEFQLSPIRIGYGSCMRCNYKGMIFEFKNK